MDLNTLKLDINLKLTVAVLNYETEIRKLRIEMLDAGVSQEDIDKFFTERIAVAKTLINF